MKNLNIKSYFKFTIYLFIETYVIINLLKVMTYVCSGKEDNLIEVFIQFKEEKIPSKNDDLFNTTSISNNENCSIFYLFRIDLKQNGSLVQLLFLLFLVYISKAYFNKIRNLFKNDLFF